MKVVMKPECRHAIEQIAALSTDELSPSEAELVRSHLENCPPCNGEWVLFERTLFTLDSAAQPVTTARRSQEMWLVCLEHALQGQTGARSKRTGSPEGRLAQPDASLAVAPSEVSPAKFGTSLVSRGSDSAQLGLGSTPATYPALSDAQVVRQPFRDGFGWFLTPTRLGWAFAGGAAVALGAAYLFAPQPAGDFSSTPAMVMLPPMPANGPGEFVGFQPPPSMTAGLVDHHAALAFEPLSDHVSPSLVYSASYSSTQP